MTYLYNSDVTHYSDNYWSTVDPYRMPGTTVDVVTRTNRSGESYRSPNNQVGGASIQGLYGVAAMHLNAWNSTLSARKSWFMFDDEIVCLGTGISGTDPGRAVETVIENRRLGVYGNNPFTVNGESKPSGPGWSETLTNALWAHLAGSAPGADIGYYFPPATTVKAVRESRSGALYDINTTYGTKTPSTRHYLTLWLEHGTNPSAGTYSYVLLPNRTAAAVAAYAMSPDITVLTNTTRFQAVKENKLGITAVNFWRDGSNFVGGVSSDHKSSVIFQNSSGILDLGISDPMQTNYFGMIVEISTPAVSVISADPGVSVLQTSPKIRVFANTSNTFGATLRARFLVTPSGTPPRVSLSSASDMIQDAPAAMILAADAQDVDGTIARVDLYEGAAKVGQSFAPPFTF
jgi:hyaluronate lyase